MRSAAPMLVREVRARLGETPFSAAVTLDGELKWRCHVPEQPQLPIYSLTKTYIAALVLQAVNAGRLDLDAPIARYRADVPRGDVMSVRHLLAHTSGLPDYGGLPEYHRDVARRGPAWSFEQFAQRTWGRGVDFEPGTGWSYSNPGYALLVEILEQVRGRTLDEVLADGIVAPLSLRQTRLASSLDDSRICPSSCTALGEDGQPRAVTTHYDPGWVWHRLIVSDAEDSARFLDALLRRRLLGDSATRWMTDLRRVPGQHPPWVAPSYGLGLMGEPDGPRGAVFGHDGGGPGYTTSAYYFARDRCAVAVLAATEDTAGVLDSVFALHRSATS